MSFKELFNKMTEQLQEKKRKNILFDFFLQRVCEKMKEVNANFPNWQESEINQDYAINLYDFSASVLWDMAVSFAHNSDDIVYDEATHIIEIMRKLLNSTVGTQLESVRIMSPSKMMAERGLVEIVERDGEKFVKLTSEGKKVAESVERQIKASEN